MSFRTVLDKDDIQYQIKETRLQLNVYRAKRERQLLQAQVSSKHMRRKRDRCSFAMHEQFDRLRRMTVVMYVAFVKKRRNQEGSYAPAKVVTNEAELLRYMHHTVVYKNQIIHISDTSEDDEHHMKKMLDSMTDSMTKTELKIMNAMCRIAAENEELEKKLKKKLEESQKELDEAREKYKAHVRLHQQNRSTLELRKLAVAAEKAKIKEKIQNLSISDGISSMSSLEGTSSHKPATENYEQSSSAAAANREDEAVLKGESENSTEKCDANIPAGTIQKEFLQEEKPPLSKAEEAHLLHQLDLVEELAEEDFRLTQATFQAEESEAGTDASDVTPPARAVAEENQRACIVTPDEPLPREESAMSVGKQTRIMEEIQLAQEAAEEDSRLADEGMGKIQDTEARLFSKSSTKSQNGNQQEDYQQLDSQIESSIDAEEVESNDLETIGAKEKAVIENEVRRAEDLLLSVENTEARTKIPMSSKQESVNNSVVTKVEVESSTDSPTRAEDRISAEEAASLKKYAVEERDRKKQKARRRAAEETKRYQEAIVAEEEAKFKKLNSQSEIPVASKSKKSIDNKNIDGGRADEHEEADEDDLEAMLMAEAKKKARNRKAKRAVSASSLTVGSEDSSSVVRTEKSPQENGVVTNNSDSKRILKMKEKELDDQPPDQNDDEDETAPTSSLEDDSFC